MKLPINQLFGSLRNNGVSRFIEHFESMFPDSHMKDLVVDEVGPGREVVIEGARVVNFGSDSFLGLDQDPRVKEALIRGIERWGTHNGSSRAFSSVRSNIEAEEKIAEWLGTEAALIFPSVTLANAGAIPGLVTKSDVILADEYAHNSIHEGNKIARANGTKTFSFRHNDVNSLREQLIQARPYRHALITIDGVYSMSGELPPLREMHALALEHNAILYIDDAHGTGVMGQHGRGTVHDNLGSYDNVFVIGSLSKGFSCLGGFIGCPAEFKQLLKIRSNSYIFGGPVAPCYLDAIVTVVNILVSNEYEQLHTRLQNNLKRLVLGAQSMGFQVMGGNTPIISILVGDEEATLRAGMSIFESGYYVQSVIFPAVPYHAGVLRIQVNANHTQAQIDGLLNALDRLEVHQILPYRGAEQAA